MPQVLVCGDVRGQFGRLFKRVHAAQEKSGPFACLFCVGDFFPGNEEANVDIADYISGKVKAPVPTYFICGGDQNTSTWLQAMGGSSQLCDNVEYLGGTGVRTLHGIKVGFVSGSSDSDVGQASALDVEPLAAHACERGFSGWESYSRRRAIRTLTYRL